MSELPRWLALGGLLIILIFFATSETALFGLGPLERLRLKERWPRRGALVEAILSRPRRLLITVLVGVELVNILSSVVGTSLALTLWGPQGKWLALWVIAPTFLLVGEIIPKSLALAYPQRLAVWVAPLLKPAILVLTPLRVLFLQLSRGLLAMFGFRPDLEMQHLHQEDFIRMVEDSHRLGAIAAMERDFIQNLLGFGEVRVGSIMVPRPDIFALPVDLPFAELVRTIKQTRFSRAPIYQDNLDNILGILHAKDLLDLCRERVCDAALVRHVLRPAYYVPENKKAFELLSELQTRHLRLALVVDEYGALVGLVTVEDLLEELCGDIPQEYQAAAQPLNKVGPGVWRVRASLSIADFNDALGVDLPAEDFDTIGGLVLNLFGRLPREGARVTYDSLNFRVLRLKGARILEVEVRLAP